MRYHLQQTRAVPNISKFVFCHLQALNKKFTPKKDIFDSFKKRYRKFQDLDFVSSERDGKISAKTYSFWATTLKSKFDNLVSRTLWHSSGENRRYLSRKACVAMDMLLAEKKYCSIKICTDLEDGTKIFFCILKQTMQR